MTETNSKKYLVKSIWENASHAVHHPLPLYEIINKYKDLTKDPQLKHIEQEGVKISLLLEALSSK